MSKHFNNDFPSTIRSFDGATDLLAREQERKIKQVEAIIGKPIAALTDHAKYCRLSKQAGGLCARARDGSFCVNPCHEYNEKFFIYPDFTTCFIPEKQQPVELPKDPLGELMEETIAIITTRSCGRIGNVTARDILNKFIAKVGALNG